MKLHPLANRIAGVLALLGEDQTIKPSLRKLVLDTELSHIEAWLASELAEAGSPSQALLAMDNDFFHLKVLEALRCHEKGGEKVSERMAKKLRTDGRSIFSPTTTSTVPAVH